MKNLYFFLSLKTHKSRQQFKSRINLIFCLSLNHRARFIARSHYYNNQYIRTFMPIICQSLRQPPMLFEFFNFTVNRCFIKNAYLSADLWGSTPTPTIYVTGIENTKLLSGDFSFRNFPMASIIFSFWLLSAAIARISISS